MPRAAPDGRRRLRVTAASGGRQQAGVHLVQAVDAEHGHVAVDLGAQQADGVRHAGLAADGGEETGLVVSGASASFG